jgi:hypothetical protein
MYSDYEMLWSRLEYMVCSTKSIYFLLVELGMKASNIVYNNDPIVRVYILSYTCSASIHPMPLNSVRRASMTDASRARY